MCADSDRGCLITRTMACVARRTRETARFRKTLNLARLKIEHVVRCHPKRAPACARGVVVLLEAVNGCHDKPHEVRPTSPLVSVSGVPSPEDAGPHVPWDSSRIAIRPGAHLHALHRGKLPTGRALIAPSTIFRPHRTRRIVDCHIARSGAVRLATMWAITADRDILPSPHCNVRRDIPTHDPRLDHVTGLTVVAVDCCDHDDGSAINLRGTFPQDQRCGDRLPRFHASTFPWCSRAATPPLPHPSNHRRALIVIESGARIRAPRHQTPMPPG